MHAANEVEIISGNVSNMQTSFCKHSLAMLECHRHKIESHFIVQVVDNTTAISTFYNISINNNNNNSNTNFNTNNNNNSDKHNINDNSSSNISSNSNKL